MSQPQHDSPTLSNLTTEPMVKTVWVLRQSYLAYERFFGVFSTKEKAQEGHTGWAPVKRKFPSYMMDSKTDPFDSPAGSVCTREGEYLWVVEPHDLY